MPLVAGDAIARKYPGNLESVFDNDNESPEGGVRLDLPNRALGRRGDGLFAASSVASRCNRFAFACSNASCRVRVNASLVLTLRAEPRRKEDVGVRESYEVPTAFGDGVDSARVEANTLLVSFRVSFRSRSSAFRRASSVATASRSRSVRLKSNSLRRAFFTRANASFVDRDLTSIAEAGESLVTSLEASDCDASSSKTGFCETEACPSSSNTEVTLGDIGVLTAAAAAAAATASRLRAAAANIARAAVSASCASRSNC